MELSNGRAEMLEVLNTTRNPGLFAAIRGTKKKKVDKSSIFLVQNLRGLGTVLLRTSPGGVSQLLEDFLRFFFITLTP